MFTSSSKWPSSTVTTWGSIPTSPRRAGGWTEGCLSLETSQGTLPSPRRRYPACCSRTSPVWPSSTGRSGSRYGRETMVPRRNTGGCPNCWWNSRSLICPRGQQLRWQGRILRRAHRCTWRGHCGWPAERNQEDSGGFMAFQSVQISGEKQVRVNDNLTLYTCPANLQSKDSSVGYRIP